MSLSAMLGRNVNLSETRARLMSGDMAGGASALKSALGGIDIGSMNAFQKQALAQSTGMGIEQLMELTQSKGGGTKGTLSEKAGLKTGRDIAKGARDMDISTKAGSMKMEQEQRLKMLEVEHQHRLEQIEKEEAWKVMWEIKYGKNQALALNAANKMVEAASGAATYASLYAQGVFENGAGFAAMGLNTNAATPGYKSNYTSAYTTPNFSNNTSTGNNTTTPSTSMESGGGGDMYSLVKEGFNQMIAGWNVSRQDMATLISWVDTGHDNYFSKINTGINTLIQWVDTNHINNFSKLNDQIAQLNTIETNGYTELLKRADVTNTLLDTLIEATVTTASKPINISGKRVSDVMKTVKTQVYGITGTT
jgi:hypothetical protein